MRQDTARAPRRSISDAALAWRLMAPALALLAAVAIVPLAATAWESLHRHDLRLPWLGQPFVGLANYVAAFADERFLTSLRQTLAFVAVSVTLEIALGLALALTLDSLRRGRALARVVVLLPWALPTVVAALVWRFMFDGESGLVNALTAAVGLEGSRLDWFSHQYAAWVPIVLGDVWKTTPFVALLLLAGLQTIDAALHDAARLDGAGEFLIFRSIVFRLIAPAFVTVLLLSFVASWNNYFLPLIVLSTPEYYPLTVGLSSWYQLAGAGSGGQALFSIVLTGALVSIVPVIVVFLILQRFWQGGLAVGAVK